MKKILKHFFSILISFTIIYQNIVIYSNAQKINTTENLSTNELISLSDDGEINPHTINKYNMGNKDSTSSFTRSANNTPITFNTLNNSSAIGSGTVSNTNSLNVRSGPGTSYEIIGTLNTGDSVEILEKNKNWYKISYNQEYGYIYYSYITLNPIEKGLDVSKWNDDLDWQKIKDAGFTYVIIRAGSSYNPSTKKYDIPTEDYMFKKHLEGATKAGLKVGAYYFSYAATVSEAEIEAEKCLYILEPYKDNISYPIFFDYEYHSKEIALSKKGVKVTKPLVSNMASTFLNKIESNGYISGIYTNRDFGDTYFTEDLLYNNNLWIAQYSSNCTYTRPYNMWQFTETGKIDGISGKFDMNYTYLKFTVPESNNINYSTIDNINLQKYTGKEVKPTVNVNLNGKTLTLDKDYTISYFNNKNMGTANIKIIGINNYSGEKVINFDIVPDKIKNLKSSNITCDSINLSWDKINGITGYKIYKYNEKSKSYKYLTSVNKNTYTDKNLEASSNYTYKIRAYKDNYNGFYSNPIAIKTSVYPASKINGLKLKSSTSNSLTISWNKINNVTGYKIFRYDTKKNTYKLIKTISNNSINSYTDKKLESTTRYKYKIQSYKTIDSKTYNSDFSSVLSSTTKPLTPIIKLTTPSTRKIKLTFSNTNPRISGYKVYMSTSKNGTYSYIGSTKNKTFTKTNLTKNKTYYFKVRAYKIVNNSNIYSSYSNIKSIKCK